MTRPASERPWICCQIGAREHYVIPAALKGAGRLRELVTDVWVPPASPLGLLVPGTKGRFHPDLAGAVTAFNASALLFASRASMRGSIGWRRIVEHNRWFQQKALAHLERLPRPAGEGQPVLFAYSYAARQMFAWARSKGWTTVLGQIDAGPHEEQLVAALADRHPGVDLTWEAAPAEYWDDWRAEVELADRIIVNSSWSHQALVAAGAPPHKLATVPLVYEPPAAAAAFERRYPDRFTADRPLRVLFLGQIILRKGILAVIDAARELRDEPIEFSIVGPGDLHLSASDRTNPRLQWLGRVPRDGVAALYRRADVFLFPTISDGFGLTQLEAHAWRLPVVASANCGELVEDGINGVRLRDVSGQEIANVLRSLIANPARLAAMSRETRIDERHRPDQLVARLLNVVTR